VASFCLPGLFFISIFMCSESMFAPLRQYRQGSVTHRSSSDRSGFECSRLASYRFRGRWIRLCMKYVLLIAICLPAAKSINLRPFYRVLSCTIMPAGSPNSRLVYCFPSFFSVRIPHHQLHVVSWASRVRSLQLFIKLIFGLL
jgi:hypothetical protein